MKSHCGHNSPRRGAVDVEGCLKTALRLSRANYRDIYVSLSTLYDHTIPVRRRWTPLPDKIDRPIEATLQLATNARLTKPPLPFPCTKAI